MNERTNHIHILNSYLCPNTPDMDSIVVKDSNGTVLKEGDAVILTKSLDPKGTSVKLKKGMTIKNIHLTDDEEEIECRVEKVRLVIKTCYVKKA